MLNKIHSAKEIRFQERMYSQKSFLLYIYKNFFLIYYLIY